MTEAALTITIPAPAEPEAQDALILSVIAPIARGLRSASGLAALYVERLNKPDWRILFRVTGAGDWLETGVRPRLAAIAGARFVPEEEDDKWVGGGRDAAPLRRIAFADTMALLDWLDAEAFGALETSRAEASVVIVERILDLLGLEGERRQEFYRGGYQWEIDSGRWEASVFAELDAMYGSQADALRAIVAAGSEFPFEPAARSLAEAWVAALGAPLAALRETAERGEAGHDLVALAGFVARAHSNRAGVHATQEAVARYLVGRARREAIGR